MAPPRIKRYLNAEIRFVISNLQGKGLILELGCGYGRVMKEVSRFVSWFNSPFTFLTANAEKNGNFIHQLSRNLFNNVIS
ncbi:MAG: hypothetical protein ACETVQ_03225 [Candidatus Bathyarchaeia archaeon]